MTVPESDDPRWQELAEALREPRSTVTRSARSASYRTDPALVQSLREQFRRERAARTALEGEVGSLRQELAMLRAEIAVAQRLDALDDRLGRIEGARSHLRAVP